MRQKATVQGGSMVFNVLFVILNILGLGLVVLGSQPFFDKQFLLFNFIGYVLMAVSAAGLFIFRGRLMMANVSRSIVGVLFIVSGLVKANDPIGFSYKLEEYFEDGALAYRIKELFGAPGFSLEFLIQYALIISILICIVEVVLGVLLLIGGKIKLVSYLTAFIMLFFTFLTWHTANCDGSKKFLDQDTYVSNSDVGSQKIREAKTNKHVKIISNSSNELIIQEYKTPQCVSDCGCFGDALKGSVGRSLTPSESLWKDIILVYLVFWIFLAQRLIEPNSKIQNIKYLIVSLVFLGALSWVFDWYFLIGFGIFLLLGALWILRAGGYFLGNYFGSTLLVASSISIMVTYVLMYEPLKDYRPFAEGKNLLWEMNDGVKGKIENTFVLKNKRSGDVETYSEKEYMANPELWDAKLYKFVKRSEKVIIPNQLPTITDQFNPYLDKKQLSDAESNLEMVKSYLDKNPDAEEINIRKAIVHEKQIVILTALNLKEANWKNIDRIKSIYSNCKKQNIPFVLLTNASRGEIYYFRKHNELNVPIFINDETGLKAIARSNPSLMILKKGIVKGKYPHRSIPSFEWLRKNILK
jgi:uncharacterized membrane protein YphA (DoxX/SURF4 family)